LHPTFAARIRAGDPAAFEQLFREHYAALCAFALRFVDLDAKAEELVQDLFTQLWVDRASWEAPRNTRSYLFAAVRNRALNERRRAGLEADWAAHALADEDDALPKPSPSPQDLLERGELRGRVDRAIAALPERCRLVVHLRWREQMSHAEIAQVMEISVKGVEIQLTRGLRALRAALEPPA
jgi:RNA polymerase sigma-70 factor, ECF subfamily